MRRQLEEEGEEDLARLLQEKVQAKARLAEAQTQLDISKAEIGKIDF